MTEVNLPFLWFAMFGSYQMMISLPDFFVGKRMPESGFLSVHPENLRLVWLAPEF